jgi:hypothetical protein
MTRRDYALWTLAFVAGVLLLIAPAIYNGFPLLQYDTGGYLSPWFEGKLEINRSVPYGLLLVAGRFPDFWPVLLVQAALTVWVMAVTLRVHGLGNRPLVLLGLIAVLSVITTLPWLTAILLTDIFAGLGVLALYLLLLRDCDLRGAERLALTVLLAASAATHSATMVMLLGLVIAAALFWLIDSARMPYVRVGRAMMALLAATLFVLAANGWIAGRAAWAQGGFALSFGRMLEHGIVKNYLDAHCPDNSLRLCPYKDALPAKADDFFWGEGVFDKLGRFEGMRNEMRRIALGSVFEFPLKQIASIATETARQLVMVDTGAGVVNWVWNSYRSIEIHTPEAVPAMKAARQQQGQLVFKAINRLHEPLAWLGMLLLPVVALIACRRAPFTDLGEFAAAMMLAILANAAVFGTLATAHHRYGARIVWLAPFVVAVALLRLYERRAAHAIPARDILAA